MPHPVSGKAFISLFAIVESPINQTVIFFFSGIVNAISTTNTKYLYRFILTSFLLSRLRQAGCFSFWLFPSYLLLVLFPKAFKFLQHYTNNGDLHYFRLSAFLPTSRQVVFFLRLFPPYLLLVLFPKAFKFPQHYTNNGDLHYLNFLFSFPAHRQAGCLLPTALSSVFVVGAVSYSIQIPTALHQQRRSTLFKLSLFLSCPQAGR